MTDFLLICLEQILPFLPLAYAISISFNIMQTTDLALDASFIIGAGIFAKMVTMGYQPLIALAAAVLSGAASGIITSIIQYKSRINGLLASVLSSFIIFNLAWLIMDRPNISLLDQKTILPASPQELTILMLYSLGSCLIVYFIVTFSRLGILMAGLGINHKLLNRMGYNTELLRAGGFALTNALSAVAGILTSSTVGYADVNMSVGLTITGIGAVIIGQTIISSLFNKKLYKYRIVVQLISCWFGVALYFVIINILLRYGLNPLYIKMLVGVMLAVFLYLATTRSSHDQN